MFCAVGPMTFAAVMVPVTVPDVPPPQFGVPARAGVPVEAQKKTMTPPGT